MKNSSVSKMSQRERQEPQPKGITKVFTIQENKDGNSLDRNTKIPEVEQKTFTGQCRQRKKLRFESERQSKALRD